MANFDLVFGFTYQCGTSVVIGVHVLGSSVLVFPGVAQVTFRDHAAFCLLYLKGLEIPTGSRDVSWNGTLGGLQ